MLLTIFKFINTKQIIIISTDDQYDGETILIFLGNYFQIILD